MSFAATATAAEWISDKYPVLRNNIKKHRMLGIGAPVWDDEDVLHEVITKFLEKNPEVKDFEAYFDTSWRNRYASLGRKKQKYPQRLNELEAAVEVDASDTAAPHDILAGCIPSRHSGPYEMVAFKEFSRIVSEVLNELPPIYAQILFMRLDEMTKAQIADELGLDSGNMTNRENRAHKAARKLLEAKSPEMYREVIKRGGGKRKRSHMKTRKVSKTINPSA